MPTQDFQDFQDFPEKFKTDLQNIIEKRYTIDYFFTDELPNIYDLMFKSTSGEESENEIFFFDDFISLADFKRKVKIISEKIGVELTDFQKQANKNFQIPYLYGLVVGSYFIKLVHDNSLASTDTPKKNASNFFNSISKGTFEKIADEEIEDFYQIFSNTLKIGLYSKFFDQERTYSNMKFSPNAEFCGLLPPSTTNLFIPRGRFLENEINFIVNNYQTTFCFKRNIMLIKQDFIEEASNKFNSIVDRLTAKNTLDKLIMVSSDNQQYRDLVVNTDKLIDLEISDLKESLRFNKFSSEFPFPDSSNISPDEIDSPITINSEFEDTCALLPLSDKTMLATLLKIKVNTYISSKADYPSQLVLKFLTEVMTNISKIEADFQYFCTQCLNLIDSYIYDADEADEAELPPTGLDLIKEVYEEIASDNISETNHTNMLSPLTDEELKLFEAHFN
ncbi:MAG: hypothetical protein PWP62_2394 [Eubacteriaceae bacterium]|nr:hypothetical protein [Eubacteriaceae bacterium]MDK2961212.1 hypothetical protein [Eubacteriaceae bacterium]